MRARRSPLLITLALGAATLAQAPSASAHDVLVGSQPGASATVAKAPEQITLTFAEPVLGLGDRMSVKEPGGTTRTLKTNVSGTTVSAPFTDAGNGIYTVTWRVTSEDGHPVSGRYAFTLRASAANTARSSAAASSSPPLATLSGAGSSPTTVVGPSSPTTNEPGDNEPLLVIGGAVLGALALAGAFVLARRKVQNDPR